MLAVSTTTWVLIGIFVPFILAGLGLAAINVASIVRPRHAGESGPPQPLIGPPSQMTRRGFFRKVMGAGFGLAALEGFGLGSLAFLWPDLSGGFGGEITLGTSAADIKSEIRATKKPFYYAPGRFYLVEYDAASNDGTYEEGLIAEGLMALYQRCVHLGCRVPFCEASQWFECPCHGSKYNRAGEYRLGPAPRGLDRFPIASEDGRLVVNTGIIITGPVRGTNTTGQQPEGPFCVDPAIIAEEA
ncbi:MAG TPA: Rieske 2Fe-2S domain-containing protein [Actinomycetota bacterium]